MWRFVPARCHVGAAFRSEHRVREQAVPVVQAGPGKPCRCDSEVAARTRRRITWRFPSRPPASCVAALTDWLSWAITYAIPGIAGVTAHDNAISHEKRPERGGNDPAEADVTCEHGY